MRLARSAIVWAALAAAATPSVADGALPSGVDPATGFRMENYRGPTPDMLPGGTVADHAFVRRAIAEKSHVLIDAYGADVTLFEATGEWIVSKPHGTIPGATWLPGVGEGRLTPEAEAYFRDNLQRLTGNDPARGLIVFCLADCWQSWNAAKRAADWGYSSVAWYPLGTDGWTEEGQALEDATPVPMKPVETE